MSKVVKKKKKLLDTSCVCDVLYCVKKQPPQVSKCSCSSEKCNTYWGKNAKKCQNRKIISQCLMRINWDRVQFLKVSKNFFPPLVHSLYDLYRFRNSPSFPIPCLWRRWIVLIPFFFVGSLCLFAYSWVQPSTFEPLPQRTQVRARASMSAVSSLTSCALIIQANALFEMKWRLHNVDNSVLKVAPEHGTANWWLNQELKRGGGEGGGVPFPCCHCSILM